MTIQATELLFKISRCMFYMALKHAKYNRVQRCFETWCRLGLNWKEDILYPEAPPRGDNDIHEAGTKWRHIAKDNF